MNKEWCRWEGFPAEILQGYPSITWNKDNCLVLAKGNQNGFMSSGMHIRPRLNKIRIHISRGNRVIHQSIYSYFSSQFLPNVPWARSKKSLFGLNYTLFFPVLNEPHVKSLMVLEKKVNAFELRGCDKPVLACQSENETFCLVVQPQAFAFLRVALHEPNLSILQNISTAQI